MPATFWILNKNKIQNKSCSAAHYVYANVNVQLYYPFPSTTTRWTLFILTALAFKTDSLTNGVDTRWRTWQKSWALLVCVLGRLRTRVMRRNDRLTLNARFASWASNGTARPSATSPYHFPLLPGKIHLWLGWTLATMTIAHRRCRDSPRFYLYNFLATPKGL